MDGAIDKVGAIVRRIGCARTVGAETRVYHDLSIAGDDAIEMLERIASAYGVSFGSFKFQRFFPIEQEALGAYWAKKLGFRPKYEPLTVQHLAAVVERGAWFEPPQRAA